MTNLIHGDIFTKFMIEYDKSNVTSSYPSLTKYEIATILDKAYLALIAQKITGNNIRKVSFEGDIKASEDIRPLIDRTSCKLSTTNYTAANELVATLPTDMLYYIQGALRFNNPISAVDNRDHRMSNIKLLNHEYAESFKVSDTNLPWIKEPVAYLEKDKLHILVDSYKLTTSVPDVCVVTYIKHPNLFVDNINNDDCQFELSHSVAEELINLAIIMALENVESTRLQTKITTSQLEP